MAFRDPRYLQQPRLKNKLDIQQSGQLGRAAFFAVLLLLSAVVTGQTAVETPSARNSAPVLIVGSEQEFPPFSTGMTDQTAGGFTVDLWNALAREQGLKSRIRVLPFEKVLSEFQAKRIDVMINLAESPERRKFADFSTPHSVVKGAVFVQSSNKTIYKESDIRNQRVILLSKDLSQDYALAAYPGKSFILAQTSEEAFRRLAKGEADAFLLSKITGLVLLKKLGLERQIEARTSANFQQKFSFAVQKENLRLQYKVNEGLILLRETGEYKKIYNKWFAAYDQEQDPKAVPKLLLGIFVLCAFTILLHFIGKYLVAKRREALDIYRAEANFRALFETAAVGMVQASATGSLLLANQSFCTFVGYPMEELLDTNLRKLSHPDDVDLDLDVLDLLKSGEIDHFQVAKRFVRKDGNFAWGRCYGSKLPATPGSPQTILVLIQDINQELIDRININNKEARYRGLLEMGIDPTIIIDENGHITELNQEAAWRLQLDPDDTIGLHVSCLDSMLSSSHLEQAFYQALSAQAVHWEGKEIFWAGVIYRIDVSAVRIELSDSVVVQLMVRDSTERYRLNEQIEQVKTKMDLALKVGNIGCFTYVPGSQTFEIDRRMAKMIGLASDAESITLTDRSLLRRIGLRSSDSSKMALAILSDLKANPSNSKVVGFVDGFGKNKQKFLQIRSELFYMPKSAQAVQIGTCFDISEEVRKEAELKEINLALNEAKSSQDKIVAKLSHELRTPLNIILGFSQILKERMSEPEDRDIARQIISSGEHLLEMISNLLLLAEPSPSFNGNSSESINAVEVARSVCDLLRPLASAKGVQLEFCWAGTKSEATFVRCDSRSLRQIFLNVVDNAIKYNRVGGLVKVECSFSSPDELLVSVMDTGVGLKSDEIHRLFVPFFRGWAESSSVQGTGLGLPITRELLEGMGGRISVESEVGSGATFTLAFPVAHELLGDESIDAASKRKNSLKLKLAIIDCLGSREPGHEVEFYDEASIFEMRESVLIAGTQSSKNSTAECQFHTHLGSVKHSDADVFVLIISSASDLHWLDDLRKSAITRKKPCFIVLPKALSNTIRETIMMDATSHGDVSFVKWTTLRQLVRDIQMITGLLEP